MAALVAASDVPQSVAAPTSESVASTWTGIAGRRKPNGAGRAKETDMNGSPLIGDTQRCVSASQSGACVRGSHQYKYVFSVSVVNLRIRVGVCALLRSRIRIAASVPSSDGRSERRGREARGGETSAGQATIRLVGQLPGQASEQRPGWRQG